MLQLSAPNYNAARAKVATLPHGSWGIVKVPNDRRVLVFSVCGDDRQMFSYNEASFEKNYTPGLAKMLKAHAAKTPVDAEAAALKRTQQINSRYITEADGPDNPTDNGAIPATPRSEEDY